MLKIYDEFVAFKSLSWKSARSSSHLQDSEIQESELIFNRFYVCIQKTWVDAAINF